MSNKAIFWDWTGTLADESELDKGFCLSIEKAVAEKRGIQLKSAEAIYTDLLKSVEKTWKWHDYIWQCEELGVNWLQLLRKNLSKLVVLPYAKEILELARKRGYKNILTTNAVRGIITERLRYSGLADLFDLVIASDDVSALKSAGKHYERGIKELNVSPSSSFSIGDSQVQDVETPKRYGLRTVFCNYGKQMIHYHRTKHISAEHEKKHHADFEIHQLKDLEKIL